MITLYVAGPYFGLPDPSPFVMKAEILLKMSGAPYRTARANFRNTPKGKIPYIEDGNWRLGDSTFIRWYLEDDYNADFDKGLTEAEKATAWAYEKLCEDHLYWAVLNERWMDPVNFDKGPRAFFGFLPKPLRPLVVAMAKRGVRRNLYGHGMGRHTRAEIERLAKRDIDAIAAFLGDKPWLMGAEPCGADATVFAFVAGTLCPFFDTPLREAAAGHANLVAYRDRGMARWFPQAAAEASARAQPQQRAS